MSSPIRAGYSKEADISIKESSVNGFLFGNIRGVNPKSDTTKKDYLNDLADIEGSNFIILTESHLSPEINDCEISITGSCNTSESWKFRY